MESKKILLISTGIYPPDIGGPATYSKLLKEELPKRGIEVKISSFSEVRHLPKVIRHFYYFFLVFFRLSGVSAVLAQDTVSVGLPTLLAARLRKKKFLVRVPGDYAWEQSVQRFGVKEEIDDFQIKRYGFKVELLRSIQKFVVSRADAVITPSNYFNRLVSGWIRVPGKVKTIYNGIKLEDGREALPNKFVRPTIISAGRLVPWKGFSVLVETMADLPDYDLVIVGEGPDKEILETLIRSKNLEKRVKLIGSLPRKEMLSFLKGAKVFVLNTHFESFSFQIVEAMNVGTPVIATKVGNLSEIIDNGENGILVEPDNEAEILLAIRRLEDRDLRCLLIERAKIKTQSFSIKQTIDGLIDKLNSLL